MRTLSLSAVVVACLAALLAACSGGGAPSQPTPAGQPAAAELSIFSWWTAGGEAEGLNELIKLYEAKHPNVKVVNAAVAGGAGTNAKAVLKTRMLGGDPPGTFQVHGGAELLTTWVDAGYMAPIDDLYKEMGLADKFPKALIDLVSRGGKIFAVPSNIHRGNLLYYNKEIFTKHNLTPPTTIDEWLTVNQKLKAAGVTPLALASREKWPILHLFENLLLAAGGDEFYRRLFAGEIAWTDERVKKALTMLKDLMPFVNTDHAALTWDQACGYVQQGKAAMTVMGDWAKGYFLAQKLQPDVQFSAVPTPGTVGTFFVITDTFGLPAKLKNPQLTLDFLRIVASVEGQEAFNPKKGSIPARLDVSRDKFDVLAKRTMDDFAKDKLVPSAAHGSAVAEVFVTGLNDQLSVFIADRNVEKTAKALEAAAKDAGVRK